MAKSQHRIFDAVYGYIHLREDEFKLIQSPIFQRLQWIKQLGPLHTIFPSAQHSRFSHSLGVFHIVTKMIDRIRVIEKSRDAEHAYISTREEYQLRFAALLHDIGHVPLSHVGENVLMKTFTPEWGEGKISLGKSGDWRSLFEAAFSPESSKLHECLSAHIVRHHSDVQRILKMPCESYGRKESIDADAVARIIVGKANNQILSGMLHAELDADRLDYLLRDSHFTGVGYGHIDLDYIISRLDVKSTKDKDDVEKNILCVQSKGVHTIEHYILARFFLQTQVIFNRKVRLLDLLFEDVMEYMMTKARKQHSMMNLKRFVGDVEGAQADGAHRIYEYTDAEVFTKMRQLHDDLDGKIKDKKDGNGRLSKAWREKEYINDCIKIIMDGQVPEPAVSAQRLVTLPGPRGKDELERIKERATKLARSVAKKLGLESCRVKANIVSQGVMKYTTTEGMNEPINSEAVRIFYENADDENTSGEDKVICAAASNASILKDLVEKELLILNVYYIEKKVSGSKEDDKQKEKIEKDIKQDFMGFVKQYFQDGSPECGCMEGKHLCQLGEVTEAASNEGGVHYRCIRCGRTSPDETVLCIGQEKNAVDAVSEVD